MPVASWSEVRDAEAYELTLYSGAANGGRDPASGRILMRKIVPKTSFELKGLGPGQYLWTVKAIDRLKRRGSPMALRSFSVTYGEVLGAPESVSPEVQ